MDKLSKIFFVIIIILVIALGIMTYLYISNKEDIVQNNISNIIADNNFTNKVNENEVVTENIVQNNVSNDVDSNFTNKVNENEVATNNTMKVTLYFSDEEARYLRKEEREINIDDKAIAKKVVMELIEGPKKEGLLPTLNEDIKILSINIKNGLCTVDLSSEFIKYNTGGSTRETFAVYSIVNSLCELDTINQVKINIEGNRNPVFGGHFSLEESIKPDYNIVK